SERETLAAAGAILVEEPVVREGRLVTADSPEAAPAFAAALVDLLRRDRASRLEAAQLLAGPRAQVDAGRHDEARAALLRIAEERRGDPHVAPWALAEAAYSFYLQKRFEEAAAAYARAAREYPASDAFGRAQACAADVLQRFLSKPREAAEAWRALIDGDCDDGEPTGNAASPYRNWRHRACLRLLEIHLELNEPAKALQAGLDALHRGFFVSHCPEALEEAQDEARAGAARVAAGLLGFRADEAMRETASGAAEADRYLLLLGKAYAAKGEASKAKKAFAALEFAFPGSAAAREIPKGD
ncbi:MAG: hypothetical protein MUC63_02170, partial [Planctomycetes bacterium]|nr:hypothetical protein [Planctomycetota bacterium]